MKNKKFLGIFGFVVCLTSISVFSGCNKKEVKFDFDETSFVMEEGDKIALKDVLVLENIELAKLDIKSTNTEHVIIEDNKIVAVESGFAFVQARYNEKVITAEVVVNEFDEKATTPNNLAFDKASGEISWNNVLVGANEYANSYTVKIVNLADNSEKTEIVKNKTYYTLKQSGDFDISVKVNGATGYADSDYSKNLVISKLGQATQIEYNEQTSILSWQAVDGVAGYRVYVNGVLGKETTSNQIALNFNQNDILKYEVVVQSIKSNNNSVTNVIESSSESVVFNRLSAPQLKIQNGKIVWNELGIDNLTYTLNIKSDAGTITQKIANNGSCNLSGYEAGLYSMNLVVSSNNPLYLTSTNTSEILNVEKLAKVSLSFDKVTNMLSASMQTSTDKVKLQSIDSTSTNYKFMENGKFLFDATNADKYNLTAINEGDNTSKVSSDISNEINITVLGKVENVAQGVDNGNYTIDFDGVEFAKDYTISVISGSETKKLTKQPNSNVYGKINEIFDTATNYEVIISASKNSSSNNEFYISSNYSLFVTRQGNVENVNQNGEYITWDEIASCNEYSYVYSKNDIVVEDSKTVNEYVTQNKELGEYVFKVKADSCEKNGVLYLESLQYSSADKFKIEKQLKNIALTFNSENCILDIEEVEDANEYYIKINSNEQVLLNNNQIANGYDLNSFVKAGQTCFVAVYAKCTSNDYILDSEETSIAIEKLVAVESFNINNDIVAVNSASDYDVNKVKDFEIFVNDEKTNQLNTNTTFVVKARAVAESDIMDIAGVNTYIVSSEFSTITLNRLDVCNQSNFTYDYPTLSVKQEICDTYNLTLNQNTMKTEISSQTNVFDTTTLNELNFNDSFSFNVKYTLKNVVCTKGQTANISSNISEKFTIDKVESVNSITITENSGNIVVDWANGFDDTDLTYTLKINQDIIVLNGTEKTYQNANIMAEAGQYNVAVTSYKKGQIPSSVYSVNCERLQSVSQFEVDSNENLSAITNYIQNNEYDKVEFKVGGNEVTNLENLNGEFEVEVKIIAKGYTSGKNYYLSSATNTFSFQRIEKMNSVVLNNPNISFGEVVGQSNYNLKFDIDDDNSQEILLNSTSISFDDPKVKNILNLYKLQSYDISVRCNVGVFNASLSANNYLSSLYSDVASLFILNDVENVNISTDNAQQNVLLNFDHTILTGSNCSNYTANLYKNGTIIETIKIDSTKQYNFEIADAGSYKVGVIANGANNSYTSKEIFSSEFKKLAKVSNIEVDDDYNLTFTGVVDADEYIITCAGPVNFTINTTNTTYNILSKLQNRTAGDYNFTIIAVGNQLSGLIKTLSSTSSDVYTKTKSNNVSLSFTSNSFEVVDESCTNKQATSYIVVIKIDNNIVETCYLVSGQTYTIKDSYSYISGGKVNFNNSTEFEFITAKHCVGELVSDTTSKSASRIASVSDFGFKRNDTNESASVYLTASKCEYASSYVVKNKSELYTNFIENSNTIQKEVTDSFAQSLGRNFNLSIVAKGSVGSDIILDSAPKTVTGSVLDSVQNFGTKSGKLVWDKNSNASDYLLSIGSATYYNGYVTSGVHTTNEDFEMLSGNLVVNIKNIGNVSTSLKQTDIVLDSLYLENNLNIQKLRKITDFAVTSGYLSFEKVEDCESYTAYVNGVAYTLTQIPNDNDSIVIGYSKAMYSSIETNKIYESVFVVANSNQENMINSDRSNSISMYIPKNTAIDIQLTHKVSDISISYLEFSGNAGDSYILYNNGAFVEKFSTAKYQLDKDGSLASGKTYSYSVAVSGSSIPYSFTDKTNLTKTCYKLNSEQSSAFIFTKLEDSKLSVKKGVLSWEEVENATSYFVYLGDQLIGKTNATSYVYNNDKSTWESNFIVGSIKNIDDNIYSNFSVKAVTTLNNCIAGNLATYADKDDNPVELTVLSKPELFSLKDGVLYWDVGTGDLFNLIDYGSGTTASPFVATMENMSAQYITLSLASNGNSGLTYKFNAPAFMKLSDNLKEKYPQFKQYFELEGFPKASYGWFDKMSTLSAGYYSLSAMQNGNDVNWLSSDYNEAKDIYVPYGPEISYNFNKSTEISTLSWNSVAVPTMSQSNVTYVVVGQKDSKNTFNINERQILATTKNTSINLTKLINGETSSDYNFVSKLNEKYTSIYVYVQGNSNETLNGKNSNMIDLSVLSKVQASVEDGVLVFKNQIGSTGYKIEYTNQNNETGIIKIEDNSYTFVDSNGKELESGVYTLNVWCLGDELDTAFEVKLTGPKTDIGEFIKHKTPTVSVKNGLFEIDHISDVNKYIIDVEGKTSKTLEIDSENDKTQYISTFTGSEYKYYFTAKGNKSVNVSATTSVFVNSAKTKQILGTMLNQVKNVKVIDGILVWDVIKNQGENVLDYILYIQPLSSSGNNLVDEVIVIDDRNAYKYESSKERFEYTVPEQFACGNYSVSVVGYIPTGSIDSTYTSQGEIAYYLRSLETSPYTFYKYDKIVNSKDVTEHNIYFCDGKFEWNFDKTNLASKFEYELTFKAAGDSFVYRTTETYFDSYAIDRQVFAGSFNLYIKVVPKDTVEGYASSDAVYYVQNDANVDLYQIDGVSNDDVKLVISNDEVSISFNDYSPYASNKTQSIAATDVTYLIHYYVKSTSSAKTQPTYKTYALTLQNAGQPKQIAIKNLDFELESNGALIYFIQVRINGNKNFVTSYITDEFSLQLPSSVKNIEYDEAKQSITWEADNNDDSKDLVYIIRDELIKVNENGEIVYDENDEMVIAQTNEYVTFDSATKEYFITNLGYHRISVAVMIKNFDSSNGDDSGKLRSSFVNYEDTITCDMFKLDNSTIKDGIYASDGSVENPYLIANENHFASISHRLNKLSYQNAYIKYYEYEGELLSEEITENTSYYNFKQVENLSISSGLYMDSNYYNLGYNGNYKTITNNVSLASGVNEVITLFPNLNSLGYIKNIKLCTNYTGALNSGVTIAMLSGNNKGSISNIILGNKNDEINIISSFALYVYGITYVNNGTIENVINYYNVNLETLNSNAYVMYSAIAGTNREGAEISQCGSYGNVAISSLLIKFGSVATANSGKINRCFIDNSNVTITIKNNSIASANVCVGGIVGTNAQTGTIGYSYANITNFAINREGGRNTYYQSFIGGLCGSSESVSIYNCYVYTNIFVDRGNSSDLSIGNLHHFAYFNANLTGTGTNTKCFYNKGVGYAAVNDSLIFDLDSYNETLNHTLIDTNGIFDENPEGNGNPKLSWVKTFLFEFK